MSKPANYPMWPSSKNNSETLKLVEMSTHTKSDRGPLTDWLQGPELFFVGFAENEGLLITICSSVLGWQWQTLEFINGKINWSSLCRRRAEFRNTNVRNRLDRFKFTLAWILQILVNFNAFVWWDGDIKIAAKSVYNCHAVNSHVLPVLRAVLNKLVAENHWEHDISLIPSSVACWGRSLIFYGP